MILADQANGVRSREEFTAFVRALRRNLLEHSADWENAELAQFLEAMAAWVDDMDGYFDTHGVPMLKHPTWTVFAQILAASKDYE